ncbi:hypothetical protein PG987_007164 [Apiospora arundinis]
MTTTMQQRPKAYVFDIFGTVVNWRHSLAKGLEASARKIVEASAFSKVDEAVLTRARDMTFSDWEWFAFQWYKRYIESSARPKEGEEAAGKATFIHQEELHRRNLDELISEFQLDGLWGTDAEKEQLVHLWHELDAWPDSAAALARFAKLGPTAMLSDGSVALLTSLEQRNGLGFNSERIWGSDTWMAYKPDPAVYLGAVKKLGLEPGEVALVAAHLGDLKGAKKCGLKALYVERPFEERYTEAEIEEARREGWVDVWVPYGPGGLLGIVERLEAMEK